MNIIGHKYIFITISLTLAFASIALFGFLGLRLGIDFTGGSFLELEFVGNRPSTEEIHGVLSLLSLGSLTIQPLGEKGVSLRFKDVDESTHQEILQKISVLAGLENVMTERKFDAIGPTIGRELKQRAFIAIGLTIAGIVLYLAWAFRKVSKPISSWKYGVVAIIALAHDVAIPVGVFVLLGHFHNLAVDSLFLTALLTVMGFSVHDTIVIFDRIRENLLKAKSGALFGDTVNRSVNETMGRSINTSFTVLIVLFAIYLFGGETTKYFALALMVGITFGTYSSIFLASPLLVAWDNFNGRRKK